MGPVPERYRKPARSSLTSRLNASSVSTYSDCSLLGCVRCIRADRSSASLIVAAVIQQVQGRTGQLHTAPRLSPWLLVHCLRAVLAVLVEKKAGRRDELSRRLQSLSANPLSTFAQRLQPRAQSDGEEADDRADPGGSDARLCRATGRRGRGRSRGPPSDFYRCRSRFA